MNVRMSTVMFHFVTVHFQFLFDFIFIFLKAVWMGSKLKAEDLQKMQLNSTHFILPHTLPIYSLDIVLYISAEKSLGPLWFSPTGAH